MTPDRAGAILAFMRKTLGLLALVLWSFPASAVDYTGAASCAAVPPNPAAQPKTDCARLTILKHGTDYYRNRFYPGRVNDGYASSGGGEGLLSMSALEREAQRAHTQAATYLRGIRGNDLQCQGVAQALSALIPVLQQSEQNYNAAKRACPQRAGNAKGDCWNAASAALGFDEANVKPLGRQYVAATNSSPGCVHESFLQPVSRMAYSPLARPKAWKHPECMAAGAERLAGFASGFKSQALDDILTGPRISLQQAAPIVGALAAAPDGDNTPGLTAAADYTSAALAIEAQWNALHCAPPPDEN